MKEIMLTQGAVSVVDDEDFEMINSFKWQIRRNKYTSYACRIYRTKDGRKEMSIHQMILKPKEGYQIDHIDGDGLNNRRDNLRYVTKGQNRMNMKNVNPFSSSKFKGVTLFRNKWMAQLRYNDKHYYLGVFHGEIDAARAYDKKAIELFGVFARPNFECNQEMRNREIFT
jgi:hypothetical protein